MAIEYNEDPDFGIHTGGKDDRERRGSMYPNDLDIRSVLTIDTEDIDQELVDIAPNLAYWTFLLNRAKADHRQARVERDDVYADLFREYQQDLQEELGKRPVNAQVEAAVHRDEEWHGVQEELAKAELRVNDLTAIVDGIKVKADALRSLCANLRAEREALLTAQ